MGSAALKWSAVCKEMFMSGERPNKKKKEYGGPNLL